MRKKVNATLISTKWGRAIKLEEGLAFLDYSGDCRDFELGKNYTCEIFYTKWYFGRSSKKERPPLLKDPKNHIRITKDSFLECEEEFKRIKENEIYGLEENLSGRKPQAYFRIIE